MLSIVLYLCLDTLLPHNASFSCHTRAAGWNPHLHSAGLRLRTP